MSFKKFGKKQIKEEIKKAEDKIKNKCKQCGYKTKTLKSKSEHVMCQNKFCKKKQNIWEGTIFYQKNIKNKNSENYGAMDAKGII